MEAASQALADLRQDIMGVGTEVNSKLWSGFSCMPNPFRTPLLQTSSRLILTTFESLVSTFMKIVAYPDNISDMQDEFDFDVRKGLSCNVPMGRKSNFVLPLRCDGHMLAPLLVLALNFHRRAGSNFGTIVLWIWLTSQLFWDVRLLSEKLALNLNQLSTVGRYGRMYPTREGTLWPFESV